MAKTGDKTEQIPETKRPFFVVAKELGIPPHIAAGVRALRRWDDLFDVTTSETQAAVREFGSIRIG
jgi:hypothetical protein